MDERVKKCLDTLGEAIKSLVASANSELEVIGLVTVVLDEFKETYEKAVNEGFDELEKREKEGKKNGIIQ